MKPGDCSVLRKLFQDEERSRLLWGRFREGFEAHPELMGLAEGVWREHVKTLADLMYLAEQAGCDLLGFSEEEAKSA